jgi:hypothetical protein
MVSWRACYSAPSWQYIVDFGTPLDLAAGIADGFSHLLAIGALDGIKQCEMETNQ